MFVFLKLFWPDECLSFQKQVGLFLQPVCEHEVALKTMTEVRYSTLSNTTLHLAGGCNVGNRFCGGAGKGSGWRGATAVGFLCLKTVRAKD